MTHRTAQPARVRLLREIAGGPMSGTFVAERRRGAERDLVTIKVLRQRTKGDVDRLMKVRDASRELAALRHPGIVCVEDVARVGDLVALVEPWVDGVDLADCLEAGSPLADAMSPKARCEIVLGIAEALDAALREVPPGGTAPLGRIHRDVRPTNVMIGQDGQIRLMDFGTGFTTLAGRSARAGALQKGIIKYMSPARREGKRGGSAADIYSLGIVAVELFRRRALRRLRSQNPDHDRYLAEVVARLTDLGTGTHGDDLALRNILLRMVAFDPEARPDAHEVAVVFQGLADRARGPGLERFAHAHVRPAVDPASHPDDTLGSVVVRVLETGATFDDVPVDDGSTVPDRLKLGSGRAGLMWEETGAGWRETGVETADEMAAFYDDEDTMAADTPLPGAPRLGETPAVPERVVIAMDEFDTESTTVPRAVPPEVDTFPTDRQRFAEARPRRSSSGRWLVALAAVLLALAMGAGLVAGAVFAWFY